MSFAVGADATFRTRCSEAGIESGSKIGTTHMAVRREVFVLFGGVFF